MPDAGSQEHELIGSTKSPNNMSSPALCRCGSKTISQSPRAGAQERAQRQPTALAIVIWICGYHSSNARVAPFSALRALYCGLDDRLIGIQTLSLIRVDLANQDQGVADQNSRQANEAQNGIEAEGLMQNEQNRHRTH
jgi:hypothetical protein